ncbi:MAG: diaminopropionate ammonia-lyase [Phascolarctobacterium sp.]|nr:diaminopropionate ammonia-lyase [Phascolarctobacterium sp.]
MIKAVSNKSNRQDKYPVGEYGVAKAKEVCAYHQSYPEYSMTPLVKLDNLASALGVSKIMVKDESKRFGLNAFKVLGGSYCIGKYIAERLALPEEKFNFTTLVSDEVKAQLGELTFVTATDGNHGRGVAWTANRLGHKSVVFMPEGTVPERLENIRKLDSDASITDMSYDDCVRKAKACSDEYGWVITQDTAWEGYEEIPKWIMQGYTTIAYEIIQQIGEDKPTHVFLQAGVGSMAGAIAAFLADYYKEDCPVITIVEPNKADCIYRTAEANDGKLHFVTEKMDSIMAGLCCGEPCTIAWEIMESYAKHFVSMPDYVTAKGMRVLGNPLPGDEAIVSGESGASCFGLVVEVLQDKDLAWLKEQLGLNAESKILCISTEGDTDKANYRSIVWDGAYHK